MRFTSLEEGLGLIQRSPVQYMLLTTSEYFMHLAKEMWKQHDAESGKYMTLQSKLLSMTFFHLLSFAFFSHMTTIHQTTGSWITGLETRSWELSQAPALLQENSLQAWKETGRRRRTSGKVQGSSAVPPPWGNARWGFADLLNSPQAICGHFGF